MFIYQNRSCAKQNYILLIQSTSLKATDQQTTEVAMCSYRNQLAEEYFDGHFRYTKDIASHISQDRFSALSHQFSAKYDDFYHSYFAKLGKAVPMPTKP